MFKSKSMCLWSAFPAGLGPGRREDGTQRLEPTGDDRRQGERPREPAPAGLRGRLGPGQGHAPDVLSETGRRDMWAPQKGQEGVQAATCSGRKLPRPGGTGAGTGGNRGLGAPAGDGPHA